MAKLKCIFHTFTEPYFMIECSAFFLSYGEILYFITMGQLLGASFFFFCYTMYIDVFQFLCALNTLGSCYSIRFYSNMETSKIFSVYVCKCHVLYVTLFLFKLSSLNLLILLLLSICFVTDIIELKIIFYCSVKFKLQFFKVS